jgi:hypothetical protein
MVAVHDDFTGPDGPLNGRVAPTGQVWSDTNDALRLNSGLLTRNPDLEGTTTGSYARIDAAERVTMMEADISWTGTSSIAQENGAVVLICANDPQRSGNPPNQGIYVNCIHAVFGLWQTSIAIWEDNASSAPAMLSYTYPGGKIAHDGTVYRIGIYMDGDRLGALMPNGVTLWAGDARLEEYTGRHMIFQTYNVVAPNLRPRIEEVWADTALLTLGDPRGVELPY